MIPPCLSIRFGEIFCFLYCSVLSIITSLCTLVILSRAHLSRIHFPSQKRIPTVPVNLSLIRGIDAAASISDPFFRKCCVHAYISGMKHAVYCMSALHPRDITKRSHDIISGFCKFSELQGTADHCRVLSSRFYPQTDAFSGKQILSDLHHSFFPVDPKLADREHLAPAPLICDDLYGAHKLSCKSAIFPVVHT